MKILKQGEIPKGRVYNVTCLMCNSELEYNILDIKILGKAKGPVFYIECGYCKYPILHTPTSETAGKPTEQ
jgi:hypothetical protein